MKRLILILLFLIQLLLFPRSYDNYGFPREENSLINQHKQSNQPFVENRVHRAGLFWMNVTNRGYLGRYLWDDDLDQCTNDLVLGAEMPGGSGINYMHQANLWFGGYLDSAATDIVGAGSIMFQGPLVSTANNDYPFGFELQPYYFDDDLSGITLGRITEISNIEGRMNCLFEDVYDPKASAFEEFTSKFTDKGTDHYTWCLIENRGHIPLGVEVKQTSYAWPYDFAKKFVIVDYTIYNRNVNKKDIYNFFMGVNVDPEVMNTVSNTSRFGGYNDDLSGFIEKWNGYIDPATGEQKSVDMNMIWSADNDGREYQIDGDDSPMVEPEAGSPLDGATGVLTVRVLRNPNPNLRYSFNLWNPGYGNESLDWGPRWQPGMHSNWEYDLTPKQKGYDDTNYDDLEWYAGESICGGRVEGMPAGDRGRYMVLSNDEFDYNQTAIREVYLGMETQAEHC